MSNGFAIPLFWLIVLAIWFYVKVTTEEQRQTLLVWFFIVVFAFSALGFIGSVLRTGSFPEPGAGFTHPQM
jgi:formate/nitrite transporter FocA (FNT family)